MSCGRLTLAFQQPHALLEPLPRQCLPLPRAQSKSQSCRGTRRHARHELPRARARERPTPPPPAQRHGSLAATECRCLHSAPRTAFREGCKCQRQLQCCRGRLGKSNSCRDTASGASPQQDRRAAWLGCTCRRLMLRCRMHGSAWGGQEEEEEEVEVELFVARRGVTRCNSTREMHSNTAPRTRGCSGGRSGRGFCKTCMLWSRVSEQGATMRQSLVSTGFEQHH